MYVYKPGSGFSGASMKFQPGFEMSEIVNLSQNLSQVSKISLSNRTDVFSMSEVSSTLSLIESQIIGPSQPKR